MSVPERVYSQNDVERARLKGQIVGWLQGAAIVAGGAFLLSVIGWVPTIAAVGIGGYVLYKLVSRGSRKSED